MSALLAFVVALLLSVLGHGGSPSVQGAPVPQEHVVTHALPGQVSHAPKPSHQVPPRPTHPPIIAPSPAPEPAPEPTPAPTDTEQWDSPWMCSDPVDCPHP